MKILITGGAGFIASHIADTYLKEGHEVVVIDDLSSGKKENLPKGVRLYTISVNSPEVNEIVAQEKPDIINHHAAQMDVRKSVVDPAHDATINILGTLRLLEAAKKNEVKKVIFASTGGAIYGEQDYFPADTSHKTEPRSPYGIAKLAAEKYLQFYEWTYGIPFVVLRYANVYGPRQNPHGEAGVIAIFIEKLLKGESPIINGDGKQTRDYVFVEDVVQCNLAALAPDVRGIFNVGTGIESDVNTIARELVKLISSKINVKYGPSKPGEQMRSCIHPGKLQKNPPIPLAKGLEKTVAWFKSV